MEKEQFVFLNRQVGFWAFGGFMPRVVVASEILNNFTLYARISKNSSLYLLRHIFTLLLFYLGLFTHVQYCREIT